MRLATAPPETSALPPSCLMKFASMYSAVALVVVCLTPVSANFSGTFIAQMIAGDGVKVAVKVHMSGDVGTSPARGRFDLHGGAAPHYGNPKKPCLPDEQAVNVNGIPGSWCAPSCK